MGSTTVRLLLIIVVSTLSVPSPGGNDASASDLVGLWHAHRHYGPEVAGVLDVFRRSDNWSARVSGFSAMVVVEGDAVRFAIEGDRGEFRGRLGAKKQTIAGHWIQPPTAANFVRFASPVTLTRRASGHWQGHVVPNEDTMTFFLSLTKNKDGSIGGFLRNPEANFGRHFRIEDVVREGDRIDLIEPDVQNVRLRGRFHQDHDTFSVFIPDAGGTFDFVRVSDDALSPFYPRGRDPQPYVYTPPTSRDDGWEIASLEDVGMAASLVALFISLESPGVPPSLGEIVESGGTGVPTPAHNRPSCRSASRTDRIRIHHVP